MMLATIRFYNHSRDKMSEITVNGGYVTCGHDTPVSEAKRMAILEEIIKLEDSLNTIFKDDALADAKMHIS